MAYDFTLLCYVRFLSGIVALGLVLLLLKRRQSSAALYLMLFEFAAAIWAIGDGFEAAATTLTLKLHWAQFGYLGVTTCVVMFLLFALTYTNHSHTVKPKAIILLMVIPFFTIIMSFSNQAHGLLWSKIIIPEGTNNSVYYYGPYFLIHLIYSYSVLLAGIVILLLGAIKVYHHFKIQIWLLIIGALLPFCASILYVSKLFPVKGLDPTPISLILSGIVIAISLFWLRMFDLVPMAHKQAIDNLRDGMMVVNSMNRILYVNPALSSILKMSSKQIIGNSAEIVYPILKIDFKDFPNENDTTLENQIVVEGEIYYFEIQCHPVTDKNDRIIGRIYQFSDISKKKKILDAIVDSNNHRRIEIIEKEKLILDLDAYARSVAHDLKNPIASVVSLCDLIKINLTESNMGEVLELVDIVQDQSNKMVRIIDDLLILSRIRKEDIDIVPVDINQVLADVMFRLTDEINNCNASFELPDYWPGALGHKQWIEEVFANLISNAMKYGGTPPVVKMGYEMGKNAAYRFWVKDNGKGLPNESLVKLFADFERLGRKDIKGNGFGLSIVKRIMEKLGGEVKVESPDIPGDGCTFSFTLKGESRQPLI